jgi:protein kinase C substrate 80K-H
LAFFPPSVVGFISDSIDSFKLFLVDNGILASTGSDITESKTVTEARDALRSEQGSLTSTENSLREHQADVVKDYGPNGVLRPLKGVCIQKDSGEYTYEHCFLDKTRQIPKKGGANVNMGNFARIDTVLVDEPVEGSGGIREVEKTVLDYENGQSCWNGPARSTVVILQCAEENEILKIMEDEKCVYSMVVTTPAVCEDGNGANEGKKRQGAAKDEL